MKFCLVGHDLPKGVPLIIDADILLDAGHTRVATPQEADVIINLNNHALHGRNMIIISYEPPICDTTRRCYLHPEDYHSVFRAGPCDPTKDEFPYTEDPVVFPYHPHNSGTDVVREDTTLRDRRVFFAGLAKYHDLPNELGRVGLYDVRTMLVRQLRDFGVDVYAEGPGWGHDSRHDGYLERWDIVKLDLCRSVQADFHLACENSQLDNYITEKIHHGFQSDLVVLYLGNRDIEKCIPPEAFVNLNPYFDARRRRVNAAAVAHIIKDMTQSEYDAIIHAARAWRSSMRVDERYTEQAEILTRKILRRIG